MAKKDVGMFKTCAVAMSLENKKVVSQNHDIVILERAYLKPMWEMMVGR
jgi:hypothetical protein